MRVCRIGMAALMLLLAAGTVARAGGPAGGIGFSRSWGTSLVPPTIGRSAAPAAPSLKTFPAVPPTAWYQTYPPVSHGPNLRPLERRPPAVRTPVLRTETPNGGYCW